MIEVVSYPKDLALWRPEEHPFYLELFGETTPLIDMTYAEVLPTSDSGGKEGVTAPLYEYWWTLGHPGVRAEHHHLWSELGARELFWHRLDDVAARVYMFFPVSGGWRIKELVATVKYLQPVGEQESWSEKSANEWSKLQPFVAGAGTLASQLSGVPGVGLPAAGAAPILSALAKLKLGSVPQGIKGFEWSAAKVTFASEQGVMQGVMWTLPKKMFEDLGGRLTGSLALSFIPARAQGEENADWLPRKMAVLAHAVVYADGVPTWAPAEREFTKLMVAPRGAVPTN